MNIKNVYIRLYLVLHSRFNNAYIIAYFLGFVKYFLSQGPTDARFLPSYPHPFRLIHRLQSYPQESNSYPQAEQSYFTSFLCLLGYLIRTVTCVAPPPGVVSVQQLTEQVCAGENESH